MTSPSGSAAVRGFLPALDRSSGRAARPGCVSTSPRRARYLRGRWTGWTTRSAISGRELAGELPTLRLFFLDRVQDRHQKRRFASHEVGERSRSAALGLDDIRAEVGQSLLHRLFAEALVEGFRELVDNWLRRALRHEGGVE